MLVHTFVYAVSCYSVPGTVLPIGYKVVNTLIKSLVPWNFYFVEKEIINKYVNNIQLITYDKEKK